jgi:hypothetical protein
MQSVFCQVSCSIEEAEFTGRFGCSFKNFRRGRALTYGRGVGLTNL